MLPMTRAPSQAPADRGQWDGQMCTPCSHAPPALSPRGLRPGWTGLTTASGGLASGLRGVCLVPSKSAGGRRGWCWTATQLREPAVAQSGRSGLDPTPQQTGEICQAPLYEEIATKTRWLKLILPLAVVDLSGRDPQDRKANAMRVTWVLKPVILSRE